jgi:hypothetical protein
VFRTSASTTGVVCQQKLGNTMNKLGLAVAACAAALAFGSNAGAMNVITKVYSGFTPAGGGAPYSGFVGAVSTPGITFATDFGYSWHPFGLTDFGSDSKGLMKVPTTGVYTLTLNSDDGSQAFVDGALVVDNGGPHGPTVVSMPVFLTAGVHPFEVQFFECCGDPAGVDFSAPGVSLFGVPEPATWSMMIIGMFGLGAALRRRSALAA